MLITSDSHRLTFLLNLNEREKRGESKTNAIIWIVKDPIVSICVSISRVTPMSFEYFKVMQMLCGHRDANWSLIFGIIHFDT